MMKNPASDASQRGPDRNRRAHRRLLAILLLGLAVGLTTTSGSRAQDLKQSGTVEINQVQVAFLWSANLGGGTLTVDGKSHAFTIGGLGVGGIGASSIEATGEIYNLESVSDVEGVYGQARYGVVAGDRSSGELWLENPNGVYIHLKAKRTGLALALGADGIVIALK